MRKVQVIFILALLLAVKLSAQDIYRFGVAPVLNLNAEINSNYSINGKLDNRHILGRGSFSGESRERTYIFERQDAEVMLSGKLSANAKAAGGYMLRFESDRFIHRFIQQISFTQPLNAMRIAHRFQADQTWDPDELFELRLRYRLGAEVPLSGTQVDPNEPYFKSTLEYLARFQGGLENELRATPTLGYLTSNKNAFEFGLEYRYGKAFEEISDHGFWLYFGYFIRI